MTTQTPTEDDEATQVQRQLMEMLNSVRLDESSARSVAPRPAPAAPVAAAAPQAAPAKAADPHTCPKCQSPEQFKSESWCNACGYYPKFDRTIDVSVAEEEQRIDVKEALQKLPEWVYTMVGGILGILVFSVAVRLLLPNIVLRGPIGLLCVIVGGCTAIASHLRAFMFALKADGKANLATMITLPFETWRPVARQMPETRKLFFALAWGITSVGVGFVVIDLDWDTMLTPAANEPKGPSFNPLKWVMRSVMKSAVFMMNNMPEEEGAAGAEGAANGGAVDMSVMGEVINATKDLEAPAGGSPQNMEEALQSFSDQAVGSAIGDPEAIKDDDLTNSAGNSAATEGAVDVQISNLHEQAIKAQGKDDEETAKDTVTESSADEAGEKLAKWALSEDGSKAPAPGEAGKPGDPAAPTFGESTGQGAGIGKSEGTPAKGMKRAQFLIFGYTLSITGEIHSVAVAEILDGDRVRFVDTIPVSGLSAEKRSQLRKDLDANAVAKPLLRIPYRAKWTAPTYMCTVEYKDRTGGRINDAQVVGYQKK